MGLLPKTMGTRPRVACEMRAEGVVAARAENSAAALSAAERVSFSNGAASGNGAGRAEKVAALRRVLDAVSQRGREVTLVVPDVAARVLLVDFDELPSKAAEALPVVRFRLKKLLPFDADDAAVSYQIMAQTRGSAQVLAVAMPRESLRDYEGMVREAGYEPGAVLPSTLAALAGLDESDRASLVVNAGREAVTTAIVKGGVLLLHRTVDLTGGEATTAVVPDTPKPENPPPAGVSMPVSSIASVDEAARQASRDTTIAAIAARFAAMEGQTAPAVRAPEAAVNQVGSALVSGVAAQGVPLPATPTALAPAEEIEQAVNVAAAYFEDTLATPPQVIFAAGTLGAETLARIVGHAGPLRVEEIVASAALGVGVTPGEAGGVPAGWLAGVRGALRS